MPNDLAPPSIQWDDEWDGAGRDVIRVTLESLEGDEPVPACPGWTTADLVRHLGSIHRWAAAIVLSGQRIVDEPDARATEPLDEWYAGTATALIAALQAVDPDEPVPNFARIDEVAGFWPRRQLHETCVHRVDLAQALGLPDFAWDVDPEVAGDGVRPAPQRAVPLHQIRLDPPAPEAAQHGRALRLAAPVNRRQHSLRIAVERLHQRAHGRILVPGIHHGTGA